MSGLPIYSWRLAPDGLATRRQLRSLGLRPGGQDVVAQVERPRRRRGPLVAYLYRIDLARPVRPMTARRTAALAKANAARRWCPT
ncbi:RRQRL motif-containing zinc-binding protein, partial [Streptomyces sp. WAC05950]|uniref:RRQRL motif-containing zinc-binding protein n=1 Tax=Streptomyces sp. WAC05950 TaxID=2487419 RepID=UPI000F741A39